MSATIPATEPEKIRAGDTIKWTRSLPDYLPADGWVLKYAFANAADTRSATATDNGDGTHLITIDTTASALFATGDYNWQAYVEKGTERFTVGSGTVTVLPALTSAVDSRSHAVKTLAALEAWIESNDLTKAKYQIAGRTLERIPMGELLVLRDRYRRDVANERNAERLANGLPSRNHISVRL